MAKAVCAFLRGINTGNIRIRMEDLRKAFLDMGFSEAKTVLSTGNVIATHPDSAIERDNLKSVIESGLSERFNYSAYAVLRDQIDLEGICAAAHTIDTPEGCHLYYLLCDNGNAIAELTTRYGSAKHEQGEQWVPCLQGAFWTVPKGMTLQSEFGNKILGGSRYKNVLTSRNMNTIELICRQMQNSHP